MPNPPEPTPVPLYAPPLGWPDDVAHPPTSTPPPAAWSETTEPSLSPPAFRSRPAPDGVAPPPFHNNRPGRRRRRVALVVTCSVAVLGLVAWAVIAGTHHPPVGGPTGPSRSAQALKALRVLWSTDATNSATSGLNGSWFNDTTVVDAQSDALTGYSLGTGAVSWTAQPPAGTKFCAMSADVGAGGVGVVGYGTTPGVCDHIAGIDTATGHQLWTVDLASTSAATVPMIDPHVSVAGDYVAVTSPAGTLQVLNLADGAVRWQVPASTDVCALWDTQATATTIYAISGCFGLNGDQLIGYDLATGRQTYSANAALIPPLDPVTLWGDGPVLAVDANTQTGYLFSSSATPTKIGLARLDQLALTDDFGQKSPTGFALTATTLYIQGPQNNEGGSSSLAAIDLKSGRTLWTAVAGTGATVTIISADTAGVHALVQTATGQGQVVVYASANGSVTADTSRSPAASSIYSTDTLYLYKDELIDVAFTPLIGSPIVLALGGVA